MSKLIIPCVEYGQCNCLDISDCPYEEGKNIVECPNKCGLMLLTVKGELDGLNLETYACTAKDCDQQVILYAGGKTLTMDIRKHYK